MTTILSKNYYEILGLAQECTAQEIKKNYHQLALIWHPDKHEDKKEAEFKFTFINEAYTILSDANQRALYDEQTKRALEIEQSLKEFSSEFATTDLSTHNFSNFDRTSFEILRDILEDRIGTNDIYNNNDDNKQDEIPKNLKATIKSFINQEVISSEDEYMFTEHQPIYMNKQFAQDFTMLSRYYNTEDNSTEIFATIIEDIEMPDLNEPTLKKRKSSIIIIETKEQKPMQYESAKSNQRNSTKGKQAASKLSTGFKRAFIYNEEMDNFEEMPHKKVKKPESRNRGTFYSELSEDDELNFNTQSILKGVTSSSEPLTGNLSLHDLRKRLQSQNLSCV